MRTCSQSTPALIARAATLFARGRVRTPRACIGNCVRNGSEDFVVFRKIVVTPGRDQPRRPGALFRVRFLFAHFPETVNRILSLIPIPLIIAQPGFRSKTWMSGLATGAFQGLYEWDTVEHAEHYWDSLPLRLMRNRARPGSLDSDIRAL